MCGFAGIVHFGKISDASTRVMSMASSMVHRGPDDDGYWSDGECSFGFRRLSVVDIAGGHQPMEDIDKSIVVVFNGEIYNHLELRKELESLGHRFLTNHSDTEVLVYGWKQWKQDLPRRLNGMFAFAIWDKKRKSLFLARDRYGIKPLYMARMKNGSLIFGSEIRAIHASELVKKKMNPTGVLEYFSHQSVWGPTTLFQGVEMLPAGTWELKSADDIKRNQYWDFNYNRKSTLTLEDAAEEHREILSRVVKRQLAADVPVMSYLSGGIDSSALAMLAHKLDPNIRTYACIFNLENVGIDKIVDERDFSRLMAKSLGSNHVELMLDPRSLESWLAHTIWALEDPKMGMAYVNDIIAERAARDGKVILSGTGGDEIHGGYVYRYQGTSVNPKASTFSLRGLLQCVTGEHKKRVNNALQNYHKMVNFLVPDEMRKNVFTPEFLAIANEYSSTDALNCILNKCSSNNIWDKVLYTDSKTYLEGLLVMEDKISMAHSLEARVPLLDNELVDFVSQLPWSHLFDGATGKRVFRESVRPWVPDQIYKKPKMGFGPPDASWYRGPLRPFIEKQLSKEIIEKRGVFLPKYVSETLSSHFSGSANNLSMIWSMLSFETWCQLNSLDY
jgi:asparagine synthase (glutamine-hydrolysing)